MSSKRDGLYVADPIWRGELSLGLREGYEGPETITPQAVTDVVQGFVLGMQIECGEWFPTIVWSRGTVCLPNDRETVLKITCETNPVYSPDASQERLSLYALKLAKHLGRTFHQARVYLAVYPITGMVWESEYAAAG